MGSQPSLVGMQTPQPPLPGLGLSASVDRLPGVGFAFTPLTERHGSTPNLRASPPSLGTARVASPTRCQAAMPRSIVEVPVGVSRPKAQTGTAPPVVHQWQHSTLGGGGCGSGLGAFRAGPSNHIWGLSEPSSITAPSGPSTSTATAVTRV